MRLGVNSMRHGALNAPTSLHSTGHVADWRSRYRAADAPAASSTPAGRSLVLHRRSGRLEPIRRASRLFRDARSSPAIRSIACARHLLRQSALELQAAAERKDIPDLDTKLRFRAHSAWAVSQAREAVETLWSCYGAQGLYTRDPLQRYLRDVLAISQHFSFNFDIAGSAYGLLALGGRYASPVM